MRIHLAGGFGAVTVMLFLVSCATQPPCELANPVAQSLQAQAARVKDSEKHPTESATPLSTVQQVGDERIERDYWPNGNIKKEWKTTPSFVILSEFYENGVRSGKWLSYNSGNGGPGHLKSIELWDEDGIECYSNLDQFTYVDNLSATGEDALDERIRSPFRTQYLHGIYARRNQDLTDTGLEKLSAITSLKWIDITGCKNITQRGIDEFKKALPNCEVRRVLRLPDVALAKSGG